MTAGAFAGRFDFGLAQPSRRNRIREFALAIAPCQRRHGRVIVRHVTERHLPVSISAFEDRIARIRRARLDDMRIGMDIAIAGTADTAGVDDQPAVVKSNGARKMRVRAQDQRLSDACCELRNAFARRHGDRAVGKNGVEPIDFVVFRCRVAEKNLVLEHARYRLRAQPVEMRGIELS